MVHTFSKSISSKVNVIARLEFEPADDHVDVQHVNHYATASLSSIITEEFCLSLIPISSKYQSW